jgi:hypothetical protein
VSSTDWKFHFIAYLGREAAETSGTVQCRYWSETLAMTGTLGWLIA